MVSFTFKAKICLSECIAGEGGFDFRDYVYGQILAPSCGLSPCPSIPSSSTPCHKEARED